MNLYERFIEYYKNKKFINKQLKQELQDLAGIAEKEMKKGVIIIYKNNEFNLKKCPGCEELQQEISELKESLDNAYGIRDEALDNQVRLKKENEELKEQLKQLKKSLDERGIVT